MSSVVRPLRTIQTQIPARLDRLPWSRFHWRVVAALGTVWILDGLEVTIVGSIGARLTEHGSGISMTASSIGTAAAVYVAGACCGALFFGQLTDRFGRKRLMMLTLALYIVATVTTAFAFAPWFFFLARFFTGAGIGGEYAAINSAIDELIPARNRGQIDITIKTLPSSAAGDRQRGSRQAPLTRHLRPDFARLGWFCVTPPTARAAPRAEPYGVLVDRVNVRVFAYVPLRSGSFAPIDCWKSTATGSLLTGPV